MISRPLTRVVNSIEMNVLSTPAVPYPSFAEGMALVRTAGQMTAGVQPSTGTATDIFVGFSFAGTSAYPFLELYDNSVETYVVQGGQISLTFVPVGAGTAQVQLFVFDNTANAPVTINGATQTTAGSTTVTGLTTGDTVTATYKFATSIVQEVARVGNVQPGGYSGALVGQIGVITRGVVYTDQFDASQNWAAAAATGSTQIILGANGQLTLGLPDNSATQISGTLFPGFVVSAPNELYPFLAVEFSANA
jgi:hypothetical protein